MYIHVIGCLWYYIVDKDEVWVPQKDYIWNDSPYLYELYNAGLTRKYFISLYTGIYLISSNEMCPATNRQIILAFCVMVTSSMLLANLFGSMAVLTK